MDAVIAGLVGSLGGVVVGALAQAMHASRQRRWQIADLDRVETKERRNRLWEDRRALYALTLTSMDELMEVVHNAIVFSELEAPPIDLLPQRAYAVSRQVSELRMISESALTMNAASRFVRAATDFSPIELMDASESVRAATWTRVQANMLDAFHAFHSAARLELGFEAPPPVPRQVNL